jgi:hypothetical protein
MSLPTCPICGLPVNRCRCGSGWNKERIFDVSFQCYACPNFIIFNSEDPNRIPRTVDQVNGCFKEIRGFYWDLMENAKIPMSYDNSGKKHEVKAPVTTEDIEYLTHLLHINEAIHQLLAPHFICEDIEGKAYDNYMMKYDAFNKYIESLRSTENLKTIYLANYWDNMNDLFESVANCFDGYCQRKPEN